MGVAPTISALRFPEELPATRLRPSPTTASDSITQSEENANATEIATELVLEKLKKANINVITDQDEVYHLPKTEGRISKRCRFYCKNSYCHR